MIQILAARDNGQEKILLFRLTEPQDLLDGEKGEFMSDRAVELGLGGNIFKAMGYRWGGGAMSMNEDRKTEDHRFWYRSVERDRFENGPLYYEITIVPNTKPDPKWKIKSCKQYKPELDSGKGITVLPMPEVAEV